jgi:Transposase DDE domain
MVSITPALRRIKDDLANLLSRPFIEQVCREVGHTWRDRLLDPVTVIHLFILQILNHYTACTALPRIAGQEFTGSAYCQARQRLPLKVITTLVARIGLALQDVTRTTPTGLWHGHRIILVDGSGFSMPDTPALQAHFGQPAGQAKGCGFPVAHLLAVFDAGTGLITDVIPAPLRTHDMPQVQRIHPKLRRGDLLVADRGFCSYVHLALVLRHDLQACFRMHQKQIVNFRPHRRHATTKNALGQPRSRWMRHWGPQDQVVEWIKPDRRPDWMSQADYDALPASISVRELRYGITTPGFRTRQVILVTTLLDAATYPAEELAQLYRKRWQVETNLRHLKTTLGLDVLRCKSVDAVMKEMWMFVLVYNLVRMVMLEAARRQSVAPDRISFIDAARWLAHAPPDAPLPALVVIPHRPDRIEPRVIKRRMKEFPLMKKPRDELRKTLLKRNHAA